MQVTRIDASDTHDLRRRVLRDGTTSNIVEFDGDDLPTTFHLGIRHADELVAVSTWLEQALLIDPERPAHQLRGMATAPGLQGSGLGSKLLEAGISACGERGSAIVWAHARSTALAFYERHGFAVCGDEHIDPATGLPHIDVRRAVRTPRPG